MTSHLDVESPLFEDRPHLWIQWKGTRPCIDLHCGCGHHGHVDADEFFYYYRCSKCGAQYALGQTIKLIKLTPEQADYAAARHAFLSDEEGAP